MKTSKIIKQRLQDANHKFFSNDNISDFISDEERSEIQKEVEVAMQAVLEALVIDTEHDHNTNETAKRVAKMFVQETFSGRYVPSPRITSFPNTGYNSLYASGPITVRSTCAHHFQNIVGKCWIGIFPEEDVIGLSKFNRIVTHISERPQIQEEMTTQIADELIKYAKTPNIAVVLKAEHHCMTARGVREHENDMTTAIMRGKFETDPALKQEFYQLLHTMKGHSGN